MVYFYTLNFTKVYLEERFEILDSYYEDKGYEGYYEKNKEYYVSVYHMVLDEENKILFPFEEYEEEKQWKTVEAIGEYLNKAGNRQGKKGKLRIGEETYFYSSKFYEGRFDDFFIRKGGENRYRVIAYTNISVIDSFSSYINKIFLLQMVLSVVLGIIMIRTITGHLEKGFENVKDYIRKVENRKEILNPINCCYIEFNQIMRALYRMGKRVQKAEKNQENFFQNASHELRTPLTSIQGYAECIYYDTMEDHKTAAEIILKNSHKMQELVEEIFFCQGWNWKKALKIIL